MPLTTYDELKQTIERFSHRTDLADVIDDFIDLAENAIDKKLRLRANESRERTTLGTTDRFLVLPDRFVEMRRFQLISGTALRDIQYKSPEALIVRNTSGQPKYFTITNQIEFDVTPSSDYVVEMVFYKGLNPLTSTNPTNDVLSNYPDIYLYGALHHLNNWTLDTEEATKYFQLFNEAIEMANNQEVRGRFGAAPVIGLEGWTP